MAKTEEIKVQAPREFDLLFHIRGSAPYVSNRFGEMAREKMKRGQQRGGAGKTRTKEPKDFDKHYEESMYRSADGWYGIPTIAFHQALVAACRLCDLKMTMAKLSFHIVPDGCDASGEMPLVRITKGEPRRMDSLVSQGMRSTDLRPRGRWSPGWEAMVRIICDARQFPSKEDIYNLVMYAGDRVGIGAGRPFSKNSCGCGWGTFHIIGCREFIREEDGQ